MKRLLIIDRDGVLITEPADEQIDTLEKLEFKPNMFRALGDIVRGTDLELVMVSNQDGLGTPGYPQEDFDLVQGKMLTALKNEGIEFSAIHIDDSFPEDNKPTRKPGIGMLMDYLKGDYDIKNSYVIGDRMTDMELAKNLGCQGILFSATGLGSAETSASETEIRECIALETSDWLEISRFLVLHPRKTVVHRVTSETDVRVELDIDGSGKGSWDTGIKFFDHMLEQISRHGGVDLNVKVTGDLDVDEHHTIEDTALALGQAFTETLGGKRGITRYGFALPMDDCLAQVAIDFGGRPWIEWDAEFKREAVGAMPTEMFFHFFKSFSDTAKCNLNIKAEGDNEHHKIEAIFKAFAKSIKMAVARDEKDMSLPSTKGTL